MKNYDCFLPPFLSFIPVSFLPSFLPFYTIMGCSIIVELYTLELDVKGQIITRFIFNLYVPQFSCLAKGENNYSRSSCLTTPPLAFACICFGMLSVRSLWILACEHGVFFQSREYAQPTQRGPGRSSQSMVDEDSWEILHLPHIVFLGMTSRLVLPISHCFPMRWNSSYVLWYRTW